MKFISQVTFLRRSRQSLNPKYPQYQSDRNNNKFNYYLELQLKAAAKIFICTPKHFQTNFKSNLDMMPISRRGLITPPITFFPNINLTKAIKNLLAF